MTKRKKCEMCLLPFTTSFPYHTAVMCRPCTADEHLYNEPIYQAKTKECDVCLLPTTNYYRHWECSGNRRFNEDYLYHTNSAGYVSFTVEEIERLRTIPAGGVE